MKFQNLEKPREKSRVSSTVLISEEIVEETPKVKTATLKEIIQDIKTQKQNGTINITGSATKTEAAR